MNVAHFIALAILLSACGPSATSRFPARETGCDVTLVKGDTLPPNSENIGTVSALCSLDTSTDDCLRELKDQACRLGADTVWGVAEKPTQVNGKNRFTGRAAHSK